MDCHAEMPDFPLPLFSSESRQNIQEHEKTAAKALQNINLIYNEIMAIKKFDLEINSHLEDENIPPHSYTKQKHYIKTCCNFVKELCDKCERLVSGCTSCNQCKCDSEKNLKFFSEEKSDNYQSSDPSHYQLNYTVPKPFSFCAKIQEHQNAKELRIYKMKQDLEKIVEDELKVRANYKPVPKSTYLPKYSKMVQEMEQRKIKRKEKCQEILNNTKPFNLQPFSKNFIKAKSTTDLTSENTHFRAKPIPKHVLSNEISDKLKNKEEIRKLLISERAKQTIEKSSLPFSRRTVPNTKSCVDLFNLNTHDKKSKSPNISEITKRLYIKKCVVAMKNWNEKVSKVNADEGKIQEKVYNLNEYIHHSVKQPTKKEELPFMYFPVRMSNASLLRDKQIR